MAQLVLGILFECRILSSEPEIVKIDVSALDFGQRMDSIHAPKSRAVIRRCIKNAVAVQHGLCSEPIDGPCGCLPFQRSAIECLTDIRPLSDVNEASGTKLELLPSKTQ